MRVELISAVVPVDVDLDDVATAYHSYRRALGTLGKPVEVIYVLDGPQPPARRARAAGRGAPGQPGRFHRRARRPQARGGRGLAGFARRRRAGRDPVLRDRVRDG